MNDNEKSYLFGNFILLLIMISWLVLVSVSDEALYPVLCLFGLVIYTKFDERCALLKICRDSNSLVLSGSYTIISSGIAILLAMKLFIALLLFIFNQTYSRFSSLINQYKQVLIIATIIMIFDYVVCTLVCCRKSNN